jgi:hypothetical protein
MPRCRIDGVIVVPLDLLREWLRKKAEEDQDQVDAVTKEILCEIGSQENDSQPGKMEAARVIGGRRCNSGV